ncbi:MAG: nuclear transport factor 2 family protein [Thermoleophilaceae bacterium]|nr:nuclear transport factor 2 family protein [Thermoleophilaceae bacterium]
MTRNERALREGYEAFNRRDIDTVLAFLHPEIEWIEPQQLPGARTARGHAEVRELLSELFEVWGTSRYQPESIEQDGEDLVATLRVTHRGQESGVVVVALLKHRWTIREGRATRLEQLGDA